MSSVRFRSIRNCPSEPVNLCTVSIRSSRQIWLLPSKSRNKDSHYNYCLRVVKISMYMNAWCWLWHVIKDRIKMWDWQTYIAICVMEIEYFFGSFGINSDYLKIILLSKFLEQKIKHYNFINWCYIIWFISS